MKSKNTNGKPIKLRLKILACAADPNSNGRIFVSMAGGVVDHVDVEVCKMPFTGKPTSIATSF